MLRATSVTVLLALGLTGCTGGGDAPASAPSAAVPSPASPAASTVASPVGTPDAEAVAARLRAFPEDLRPAAESVYDAVQPYHDAFAAFASPKVDTAQIRDDVFAEGRAADVLAARRSELLAAAQAPDAGPQLRRRVAALETALTALREAVAGLGAATRATPAPDGTVPALVSGEKALAAASAAWRTALAPVYANRPAPQGLPPVPTPVRGALRPPVGKGAWLLAAGAACGTASTPRGAAAGVLAVSVPARERAVLGPMVLAPVSRVAGAAAGSPQARSARVDASEGLSRYGSSTCVDVLRVAG